MRIRIKRKRQTLDTLSRSAGSLLQVFPPSFRGADFADLLRPRTKQLADLGAKILRDMLSDGAVRSLAEAWGKGMDKESLRQLARLISQADKKVDIVKSEKDE